LKDPVETYHLLINMNIEIMLFSMSLTKDKNKKKEISQFLVDLRKIKPLLKGSDLKKLGIPPGPVYTEILNSLLDEKLSGRLKTEEEEKRFVMENYGPAKR